MIIYIILAGILYICSVLLVVSVSFYLWMRSISIDDLAVSIDDLAVLVLKNAKNVNASSRPMFDFQIVDIKYKGREKSLGTQYNAEIYEIEFTDGNKIDCYRKVDL